jgi:CheY-like chemotaxis protein
MPPLVLLVDDNPDTLEMYSLGLQYEGFNVTKANDGEVALRSVAAERPDCIVADVRMPRMTGLEFRRRLTHSAETADIPVIALTGYSAQAELDTARAAGFESVLLKPCLPETLAREILRVLAASRAARSRARHASARATQVLAKAARLQDKNAELARKHREIRRNRSKPE